MYTRFRIPLTALVLAAPVALSAQSAQDFQLPPNPTPTATPRVQGPVDTEGSSIPARPRVIATPTPSPTPTPTQNATVQPLPTPTPTPIEARPAAPSTTQRPAALPTAQPLPEPPREVVQTPLPQTAPAPDEGTPSPVPTATGDDASRPIVEDGAGEAASTADDTDWLWPAVGGGLLVLLALGYALSRRRRVAAAPLIERPVVTAGEGEAAGPADLRLSAEAVKLTRSVMNATLQYRVTLLNRSGVAISGATLGADVVSAHGGLPVAEQVASPTQMLEKRHVFDRIAPGQSVRYEGQLTIPLSQARIIHQGSAALFIPLLRVRVDGIGDDPLVKTFVIGQGVPDGGRVSPFRIDEGPRSYQPIAARALD